jgi:hypothetical protein
MNESDLITLLKSAECGSDELNVAYYEWKYRGYPKTSAGIWVHGKLLEKKDVSNSVDAALGEIPDGKSHGYSYERGDFYFHIGFQSEIVGHKSLPLAILLAVVEAA